MNLIEADSRDFLLNRFHRRVESYRMHHEQNYRLYQPIRREEVRKQLEETNQLHKRWIEFQAKRNVGKAKNDAFVSNAPPFTKKLKKKLTSPEIPSSQSFNPSTAIKKSLANVSSICQDFNNHQNVYQNYDKSNANSKKIASNLEDLFQSSSNDEFSINGNKLPLDKTSSLTIHLQDKDPDDNYEKMDDEKEIDNIFLGEEWDKFWDSISRDGEMPKEVLKVLQENETSDDLTQASLNNQNFFQDNISVPSTNNAASVTLSTPFVSCDNKANFTHSALQLTQVNSFAEQRVIRNDPNYANHIPFKHNNTSSRISHGAIVGHAVEGLPSYDDVVNGRFAPSLVQHRNTPNAETNRHSLIHQQQFCHQRVQKNLICRKENDFTNNLVPYHQNNFGIITESTFYHPAASQNMYPNDFQNFGGEGRFLDFQNQSYSKMNFENYDFLNTQQQSFPSQQSYLMDERANDSEMSHNMDRNYFHWSYNDSINAYQKEDNMIVNNISTYTHRNTFFQPSNNDFKHFDPTSYSTPTVNDDRRICMGIIQHHNLPDISVETELSLIQDIINRK